MVIRMLMCAVFMSTGRGITRRQAYRLDRVKEALGDVYKCHYPYKSRELLGRGAPDI